jgi:putative transposase
MSIDRRRLMIEPAHGRLSIARQCDLVSMIRSSFYYTPAGETALNLALMRLIDEQFLEAPFYGARQMARHLRRQGFVVGRKRVRRLMARMGLAAIYQKPRTSAPHPAHPVYRYLLRGLVIDRPGQVWCADITYSAPRPGWSGVHMTGMQRRKEELNERLALCCEGARAQAAVTCRLLAG